MFNTTEWHVWLYRYPKGDRVIINHLLVIVTFNVYESRDLNFLPLKSDIIKIRQSVYKMGETTQSILPLKKEGS